MKSILCPIVLIAWAGVASAQSIPASRAADAAEIKREIEIICQAFVDKDRPTLEATHGKDWRGFTPASDHVIRGLDGYMNEATFPPGMPKGQGMTGYRISDFDVVFYGDTAVASFVLETDGMRGKQKTTQKLTILDVFHKQGARWIQVASNTSLHRDEFERLGTELRELGAEEKAELLAARESVWRSWFAGDTKQLSGLLAPELITIERGSPKFGSLASNIEESKAFAAAGGKLTRLTFPKTEFQAYGPTVILYTTYEADLLSEGKTQSMRGVATEMFVWRDGRWAHTGWQLTPLADTPQQDDEAAVQALEQIERDMGQAMVAADVAKLDRIFADDWTSIGVSGAVVTKDKMLHNFKSGVDRLEAFELGPMNVQVKGNVAVIHGSVTEKRTRSGKDIGGEYVWMDLMEKRNGTWVVVRSAGAKVK